MRQSTVLVVDDEKEIADFIELYLKNENYNVHKFYNGKDALACVEHENIDLAILDVMLPDIDGFEILKQIRLTHNFPVIMLTAKVSSMDKINGLTLGADDYIEKPFEPLELMARVKAQLRRFTRYNDGSGMNQEDTLEIAGLILNRATHQCTYGEEEITLTPLEFSILWILTQNRGKVISSENLFEQVWKEKYFKNNNNTVVLDIFVDCVFQDPFAKTVVYIFERIGMDELEAIRVYRLIFVQNKTMIIGAGFFVLLLLSFYLGMSKFTTYLRQVEGGIQMILNESKDRILLPPELNPLENKLNEIKGTLKEQRRIAEESEQRKNDIIVYLAHDLKTPLTSIIAYLSLLNESPDMSEEQRAKYIGISLEKAKRLGELINEFFEITRYNLQNITLDKKEFYLYVLLEQVMDSFAAVFKQKGLEWKIEVDDKILIYGDPDRLARVFENLLRNAVSYCYPNSLIEVYGMIDGDNAEILVRNQGKTIPEHQLNNLFEKFYRLDEARSSETGGAGLGLAIAKEIIELHDGTIKAKSQNEYTTFIIRLPRKKEEQ